MTLGPMDSTIAPFSNRGESRNGTKEESLVKLSRQAHIMGHISRWTLSLNQVLAQ